MINGLRQASVRNASEGFSGGGQVGYNYQFTPGSGIVVGVEADAQYMDLQRTTTQVIFNPVFNPNQLTNTYRTELSFLGTVRGGLATPSISSWSMGPAALLTAM